MSGSRTFIHIETHAYTIYMQYDALKSMIKIIRFEIFEACALQIAKHMHCFWMIMIMNNLLLLITAISSPLKRSSTKYDNNNNINKYIALVQCERIKSEKEILSLTLRLLVSRLNSRSYCRRILYTNANVQELKENREEKHRQSYHLFCH